MRALGARGTRETRAGCDATTRERRLGRGRRRATRANATSRDDPFDALWRVILPREVNEARREMEYFDGPGGMFARAMPWRAKPTIETPRVRIGGDVGVDDDGSVVVFDFESMGDAAFETSFNALNDVVMGGASDATVVKTRDGFARLAGTTEDVRGGFASVKCRDFATPLDLSAFDGVKVTCRGDGKTYKAILYDTDDSFNVAFHQTFVCPKDELGEVRLAFKDFVPVKRGRAVAPNDAEYRRTNGGTIIAFQFMLSKFAYGMEEKNQGYAPGPFEIEIKRVEAYKK